MKEFATTLQDKYRPIHFSSTKIRRSDLRFINELHRLRSDSDVEVKINHKRVY